MDVEPERLAKKAARANQRHAKRAAMYGVLADVESWQIERLMAKATICPYCRRPFKDVQSMSVDHKVSMSKGGAHTISNIVISCVSCNNGREGKAYRRWLRMRYLKGAVGPDDRLGELPIREVLE